MLNSKIAVGTASTLLRDKLGFGGKILSCNLTKIDMWDFPINGICSINNCFNNLSIRIVFNYK